MRAQAYFKFHAPTLDKALVNKYNETWVTGSLTAVLPWSYQECCVGFWNALLESKMETIRKKLDVLNTTLKYREKCASSAEHDLESLTERNVVVGNILS